MIFKNKHFTKRDYECTNIVACVADECPNENYVPADESVLVGLTKLSSYSVNGIFCTFYGYL